MSHLEIKTTFKTLIRETSVYKYFIELKENSLTSKGYLDIVKIPKLFVARAGEFLRQSRLKKKLTQKRIAEIIDVTPTQVCAWEKNRSKIPLKSLVKIAKTYDVSRDMIYELINRSKISLKTNLPVRLEKIMEIIKYFSPHKLDGTVSLTKCSDETLQKIKDTLNVALRMKKTKNNCNQATINSKELHRYLKTFFQYTKVPKIHPPLTNEVKLWHENGLDLTRAIICPCLQTEGNIRNPNAFDFNGNNKVLHDYFVDAVYYEYNELPTSYLCSNGYVTSYARKATKEIIDEVMMLAGNSKTSPAHEQSIEEYLREPQPHLDYLLNASEIEQKIALRIWASAEGHTIIRRFKFANIDYIYPGLNIACAHPVLLGQLKQIAKRFNILFSEQKSKNIWSGFQGLSSNSIKNSIYFLRLGGFIKGVKISANSTYHEGIDKDVLMLGILEYIRQRNKGNVWQKNLSIEDHHRNVNKIIENRKYRSADYYIDIFS